MARLRLPAARLHASLKYFDISLAARSHFVVPSHLVGVASVKGGGLLTAVVWLVVVITALGHRGEEAIAGAKPYVKRIQTSLERRVAVVHPTARQKAKQVFLPGKVRQGLRGIKGSRQIRNRLFGIPTPC